MCTEDKTQSAEGPGQIGPTDTSSGRADEDDGSRLVLERGQVYRVAASDEI